MAFNPAMLRPGATPPKREIASPVASFDEPASFKTLESANKVQFEVDPSILWEPLIDCIVTGLSQPYR